MVKPCGRGLDPLQTTSRNHLVPGDEDLGVAAVDVGTGQFVGNPILPRVDHFGLGPSGLDLCDMFGLKWVAENDAHSFLEEVLEGKCRYQGFDGRKRLESYAIAHLNRDEQNENFWCSIIASLAGTGDCNRFVIE